MATWNIAYNHDQLPKDRSYPWAQLIFAIIIWAGIVYVWYSAFTLIVAFLSLIYIYHIVRKMTVYRSRLLQHEGRSVTLDETGLTIAGQRLDLQHTMLLHPETVFTYSDSALEHINDINIPTGQGFSNYLTQHVIPEWGIVISALEIDLCYLPPQAFDTSGGPLSSETIAQYVQQGDIATHQPPIPQKL